MPEEQKPELIHLTIDDIPVEVPPGTLVWAAAKQAGIEIPIYCYHPKMPPLGACRMCFVEIEKIPKPPQTACTTPVAEGMVVHTKTDKVLKARRGTLEFLLINHPLDCPICDKAGECDLQDFTLRHGPGGTRYDLPTIKSLFQSARTSFSTVNAVSFASAARVSVPRSRWTTVW